jgi:glycosyltransferase involved in cell wall biosynthesis
MKNNKVLMLLTNPFTNDSRVLKEGRSLVNAGYDVTLACYNYGDLPKEEMVEGIKVQRIFYYKRKNLQKSILLNIVAVLFLLRYYLVLSVRFRKTDIIHCNDLLTLPAGLMLKCLSFGKSKIIYDAHEYETEIKGIHGLRKRIYKIMERSLIPYADAVLNVSESFANEYVRLYNIPKPSLVLNCPPCAETPAKDIFRETFAIDKDTIIFLYQGGFTSGRGIEMILDAFKRIKDPNKAIVFMGYGPLGDQIKKAAEDYSHIYYHDAVAPNILLDYTASADIGILYYEDTCLNHRYCSPNKLFEYTMAGIPMIASNLFEIRRLLEKYQNGIVVENNDTDSLIAAVHSVTQTELDRMKANIPEMKKKYCWENQEKVLLEVYDNVRKTLS